MLFIKRKRKFDLIIVKLPPLRVYFAPLFVFESEIRAKAILVGSWPQNRRELPRDVFMTPGMLVAEFMETFIGTQQA